jgi:Tfp pilus assembly protein PilV
MKLRVAHDKNREARRSGSFAFTLLEVMIAMAIFFTAVFAILALVSQSLRGARLLTQNAPTPGMALAISQLPITNKVEEGSISGDFEDLYPGYDWTAETTLASSNGLYQVDVSVFHEGDLDSSMSVFLYKPESTTGISTRSRFR